MKQIQKFIFIHYSDQEDLAGDLQSYHGKAVALNIADNYTPLPSLFILHEMRVRGFHPFHDTSPDVPVNDAINWQDWVITRGVWDNSTNQFHRHGPSPPSLPQTLQMTPAMTTSGGGPSGSGTQHLELNEKVFADILAATRAMPSWKACVIEGTRWTGTAEENKEKYLSILQGS